MVSRRKERKAVALHRVDHNIDHNNMLFIIENKGVKADDMWLLQKSLHQIKARRMMSKNVVIKLACQKYNLDLQQAVGDENLLKGSNIFVFAEEDNVIEVAKIIADFCENNKERSVFKLGLKLANNKSLIEDKLAADAVEALAKIPSLTHLRAQLLSILEWPCVQFVSVVDAKVAKELQSQ